jgi:hypothetical protein
MWQMWWVMSLSVCKWHAYSWNTLFPAHVFIPAVSDIGICKYVYCLWYIFVMVVTFKYLNPASPIFFHACNGKFAWIWLWKTCTEKLQLWGSTTYLYQKSKFHLRKLWSYYDLSTNTRIYSYNQQSQISADLPFTITQYITQFYKICSL